MIDTFITQHDIPSFRLKQFRKAFYRDSIVSFDDLTTWPKELRNLLSTAVPFTTLVSERSLTSKNGDTIKVVFRRMDGQKIETVLMQHRDNRNTVCVSCMVGCPVNCSFCATGKMGYRGSLSAQEIIDQVLHFARILQQKQKKITNVVFMGMGEPMLNLTEVQHAVRILTDQEMMGMSQRRITVSTSGYIPQFRKFMADGFRGRLAISLHAPTQKLREKLMPVAKLFPLPDLMSVLDEYTKLTNKRISYEYILIRNINDTPDHAAELGALLRNRLAHVNLIPYNPIPGVHFDRSTRDGIAMFTDTLAKYAIPFTIRVTMGNDIAAACGQLIDQNPKPECISRIYGT